MTAPQSVSDLLGRQLLFERLGVEDLAMLAGLGQRRRWTSGAAIFQRGDPGRELLLVIAGRIRLSVLSAEGRELSLRHAEPGALIGEIAVLDGGPRSADATAATDCEALVIARSDFNRLLQERPPVALSIIAFLCRRLRETTDQLESIALYPLEARLARFLLALVRQKSGAENSGPVRLRLALNQGEIADVIGASRPKVNRALAELAAQGAIVRAHEEIICRVDRLVDIAES